MSLCWASHLTEGLFNDGGGSVSAPISHGKGLSRRTYFKGVIQRRFNFVLRRNSFMFMVEKRCLTQVFGWQSQRAHLIRNQMFHAYPLETKLFLRAVMKLCTSPLERRRLWADLQGARGAGMRSVPSTASSWHRCC